MKTRTRTRTTAEFTDESGQGADPTVVALTVTAPAGITVYTYGSGAEIVRSAQGRYYYEHVPPAGDGGYRYEWAGSGAVDSVDVAAAYMRDP